MARQQDLLAGGVYMTAHPPVEEMWSPQLLGGLQGDSVSPGVEGM